MECWAHPVTQEHSNKIRFHPCATPSRLVVSKGSLRILRLVHPLTRSLIGGVPFCKGKNITLHRVSSLSILCRDSVSTRDITRCLISPPTLKTAVLPFCFYAVSLSMRRSVWGAFVRAGGQLTEIYTPFQLLYCEQQWSYKQALR